MNVETYKAAAIFFSLAEKAAKEGGFWVSASGGTANVVARLISRATGVEFEEAHRALCTMGIHIYGECWYQHLADSQPFGWDEWHDSVPGRYDVRTIAKVACKRALA